MKKLLITCGLPYSNGQLHVGHIAGCYLPADIYVRYQRLNGRSVQFICGSDDHGVPIKLTAEQEGKSPAEVSSFYHNCQEKDFHTLGIHFNAYGATSNSDYHQKISQDFFQTLYDKGFFEKESQQQFYDDSAEMFLPDRYVKGTCGYCAAEDQNSDQCEECGKVLDVETLKDPYSVLTKKPASIKDTYHWFIDLSQFENVVQEWLDSSVVRDHTRNFVKGLIKTGLVKRAMTRDLDWGIPLPIDDPDAKDKVLYVWFDAPIGYISNTLTALADQGQDPEDYAKWWKSEDTDFYHFIGEDNTIFHCVIWIAMLKAEGSFQLPKGVIVNNFLNIQRQGKDIEKISKSRANAIWVNEYIAEGNNPDSLRYYLTSIAPERARGVFNIDDLIQKHNSELANTLGNFVNRVLSFYIKHFGENLSCSRLASLDSAEDTAFELSRKNLGSEVAVALEEFRFKAAQKLVFDFIRDCNAYIDVKAPWSLRKENPEAAQAVLERCIEAIYTISIVLEPFLPFTAEKLQQALQVADNHQWQDAKKNLEQGQEVAKPEILFEKVE